MTVTNYWQNMLPRATVVPDCDAEVWCASVNLPPRQVRELGGLLSEDERARASRFAFERDRRRFVVTRGLLRIILGRYLSCEPGRLRFRYEPGGRPELMAPAPREALAFNVSHAADLALFAVSRSRRVGIDVERLRPIPEAEAIVRDYFSPREQIAWRALPEGRKLEAFFHGWTRKEAVLKALGVGLSCPPDRVEVTLGRDGPARLLNIDGDAEQASEWSLVTLFPAENYVGALAARP